MQLLTNSPCPLNRSQVPLHYQSNLRMCVCTRVHVYACVCIKPTTTIFPLKSTLQPRLTFCLLTHISETFLYFAVAVIPYMTIPCGSYVIKRSQLHSLCKFLRTSCPQRLELRSLNSSYFVFTFNSLPDVLANVCLQMFRKEDNIYKDSLLRVGFC